MKWWARFNGFSGQTIRVFILLAFAAIFFGLFLKLTIDIFDHEDLERWDETILHFIGKLRLAGLNGIAVDLTALGSPVVITLFTLIGIVLLWLNRDRLGVLFLLSSSIGAGMWTEVLKKLIARERPQIIPRLVEVSGQSYPSGHSLAATTVYMTFAFLTWRFYKGFRARAIILVCALGIIGLVSFSRLYLGVHYPSDVASGFFLGSAWVLLLTALFSRKGIETRKRSSSE